MRSIPRPKTERTCPICGKVFLRSPYHESNICSYKCSYASKTKPKCAHICLTCGKSFLTYPSLRGKYCSTACYHGRQHMPRKPLANRFWVKVDKSAGPDACWPWIGAKDRAGYGCIGINGKSVGTHRVAWELTNGPLLPGEVVRHKVCDNPPCCNPAHLLKGTHLDNSRDKWSKMRATPKRGERNGHAKLTQQIVDLIREKFATGNYTKAALSREYGVTDKHIGNIVSHSSW